MTEYNARIEWVAPYDDEQTGPMVDALIDYHPAVGRSEGGHLEAFITVPGENLRQATLTALAVSEAHGQVLAIEVLPTVEFDARVGLAPMPELLSVPEAAKELSTSPQAVRQRIETGGLAATRVGKAWVLQAAAVREIAAAKAARRKTAS